ncbi:hypothetical protein CIRG_02165 [Coccidioides immitis RMSCC 2394]|uniref:Uncharacterized protein n=1 Tax=Coccidioides immitis RMSCC 2394 TaxID=404692 RepID=A0A0J6Y0A6_COCIT|nr:hypothetical protein CIRG_02165 [Coccidioides immitis RMSCC 2394]
MIGSPHDTLNLRNSLSMIRSSLPPSASMQSGMINDPDTDDERHMPCPVTLNPSCKHHQPKQNPYNSSQHQLKWQKLSQPAPAYWDNLSKIWLTKDTLKELDQRSSCLKQPQKFHVSVSQQSHLKLKKYYGLQLAPNPLSDCSPECLKQIKRFSRLGGPDLSDLRNYPKPENILKFPNGEKIQQPNNWDEIKRRLGNLQPSLSPSRFSEKELEEFKEADAYTSKEKPVTTTVIPIIEAQAKPDHFYGAHPEQLNHQIHNDLSNQIILLTQDDLPMVPNFFLEVKGPDRSLAVATQQACYNGTLGAQGMHSLQSY